MAIQARNTIKMGVLSDGTISIDTDSFEEEVHDSAAQLVNETIELAGGEHKIIERKDDFANHTHVHHHGHVHNK